MLRPASFRATASSESQELYPILFDAKESKLWLCGRTYKLGEQETTIVGFRSEPGRHVSVYLADRAGSISFPDASTALNLPPFTSSDVTIVPPEKMNILSSAAKELFKTTPDAATGSPANASTEISLRPRSGPSASAHSSSASDFNIPRPHGIKKKKKPAKRAKGADGAAQPAPQANVDDADPAMDEEEEQNDLETQARKIIPTLPASQRRQLLAQLLASVDTSSQQSGQVHRPLPAGLARSQPQLTLAQQLLPPATPSGHSNQAFLAYLALLGTLHQ